MDTLVLRPTPVGGAVRVTPPTGVENRGPVWTFTHRDQKAVPTIKLSPPRSLVGRDAIPAPEQSLMAVTRLKPRNRSVVPAKEEPARFGPFIHVSSPGAALPPVGKGVGVGTMVPPEPTQLIGKGWTAARDPPPRSVVHRAPGVFGLAGTVKLNVSVLFLSFTV